MAPPPSFKSMDRVEETESDSDSSDSSSEASPSPPKKPQQDAQRDSSDDSDSDSSSSSSGSKLKPAKLAATPASAKPRAASPSSDSSSDSSSESSSTSSASSSDDENEDESNKGSEIEAETSRGKKRKASDVAAQSTPKRSKKVTIDDTPQRLGPATSSLPRRPAKYQPPSGFQPVTGSSTDKDNGSDLFARKKLEGKEIWHITAPASMPIEKLQHVDLSKLQKGEKILSVDDQDYGMFQIKGKTATDVRVLVANESGDSYALCAKDIEKTFNVQRILPDTWSLGASPTIAPLTTQKPIVKQPDGLKLQYWPPGFEPTPSKKMQVPPAARGSPATPATAPAAVRTGKSKKEKRKHADEGASPSKQNGERPQNDKHQRPEKDADSSQQDSEKKKKKKKNKDTDGHPGSDQEAPEAQQEKKKKKKKDKDRHADGDEEAAQVQQDKEKRKAERKERKRLSMKP